MAKQELKGWASISCEEPENTPGFVCHTVTQLDITARKQPQIMQMERRAFGLLPIKLYWQRAVRSIWKRSTDPDEFDSRSCSGQGPESCEGLRILDGDQAAFCLFFSSRRVDAVSSVQSVASVFLGWALGPVILFTNASVSRKEARAMDRRCQQTCK